MLLTQHFRPDGGVAPHRPVNLQRKRILYWTLIGSARGRRLMTGDSWASTVFPAANWTSLLERNQVSLSSRPVQENSPPVKSATSLDGMK